jgi:guanylate kinase
MPGTDSTQPEQRSPLLIVISGPSAVGKDAVVQRLLEDSEAFTFVVTVNTRLPRPGERPGVDYHFVTRQQFQRMVADGEMLEYAPVYDDFKGVPRAGVMQALSSGKDVVLRVDVQGAATIRSLCPEALLIFLTPENESVLLERMRSRQADTPESLELRLATFHQEMQRVGEFDYMVPNITGQLERTVEVIRAIIAAEHHRVHPRKVNL